MIRVELADEAATEALGKQLAAAYVSAGFSRLLIFLEGDLGAGKTTLTRGFLRGLGMSGKVKSPTYTLVEPYEIQQGARTLQVYHFDLYRLSDPEELTYIGAEDYFAEEAVSLVEWPQQGAGLLPKADLEIRLEYQLPGRVLHIQSNSPEGEKLVQLFSAVAQ